MIPTPMSSRILCIGEILWDALPDGLFLGGAPFNVASHLLALGQDVVFASRVGDDRLGQEALRRMHARGLSTRLVGVDEKLSTGFVRVELQASGEPGYEILEPVAWDAIRLTEELRATAETADVLVYGSLAQRRPASRQTIRQLFGADLVRVFDVNLRPPYVVKDTVEASVQAADVVKLNEDELNRLRRWFDLVGSTEESVAQLARRFGCHAVCVTQGCSGALLWTEDGCWQHEGYAVEVVDTVGAGDAFLAALLTGLLEETSGDVILDRANRLGAYVASRSGATPAYPAETLAAVADLPLAAG